MHIALVSPGWPANQYPNGIVTYVQTLRAELLKQGHQVSVICNELGTHEDEGIYEIRSGPFRSLCQRLLLRLGVSRLSFFEHGATIASTLRQLNRRAPIDVIEMEETFGWCAEVQMRLRKPVIVKLHGPAFLAAAREENPAAFNAERLRVEAAGLKAMSVLIAPSRAALLPTLQVLGLTPLIAEVIPNPMADEPAAAPWALHACEPKTLLFVGRFDRLKGADTALLAFKSLLGRDPELKLVFVGPDVGLEGAHGRVGFESYCGSLFSPEQLKQITYLGRVPRSEVFALRRRAMMTLVLSRWENQPNTVLEAMIQACPLVAVDSGGVSEIIEHGKTGLLCRIGDVDDVCAKIRQMLEAPVAAAEMGSAARQYVLARHCPVAIVRQNLDVYRRAIAMGAPT